MKKLVITFVTIFALALSMAQAFAAVIPTALKLDRATVNLSVGRTYTLKSTLTPSNTTNKTLKFTSSNTKVTTIDSTGKVTAVAAGKSTITAVSSANSKLKATCQIVVFGTSNGSGNQGSHGGRGGFNSFFETKKWGDPALRAEISKISGSTITVKVIKEQQFNRDGNGFGNRAPGSTPGPRPTFAPNQTPNFKRQVEYTGQVFTINITSSVALSTATFSNNTFTEKKLTVKDLKVGETVQLWYKDTTKKTFSRVFLSPQMTRPNNPPSQNN